MWEGSDIDVEARLQEARAQIDPNESLATSLTKHFRLRPVVARRHSLQTGTLRYFDVRYVDATNLETIASEPLGDADGRILYAITLNADELQSVMSKAATSAIANLPQVILAIPQETEGLRETIFEVACSKWVQDNTPELEGDRAARGELQAYMSHSEASVEQALQAFLSPSASSVECSWFRGGERAAVSSGRMLQEYLSDVCDKVFSKTPILRNELINRRQISSSAASARRELLSAMLTSGDKRTLGIEGFPPHVSMYFSLLQETGLHREEDGRWGYVPPKADADPGIVAAWQAIDGFLTETEIERRTVGELFELLSDAPYGMKSGLLPVLLCAALLHFDTEVALYEQGSFVPSLSNPIFERLIKTPEKFQLQRCRVAGVRETVLKRFADVILQKPEGFASEKMNLLTVVRPLTRFATSLPAYTKNTQRLRETTTRVRQCLFDAREPDKLLFTQLPQACGLEPFTPSDMQDSDDVDRFFRNLRESLSELRRAYDDLLGELYAAHTKKWILTRIAHRAFRYSSHTRTSQES